MTTTKTDTRQRIIDAASQVMIEKSYNGAGLNEILKLAGVPKGSFYHFFQSKEHLGIAIIEKSAAQYAEHLRTFFADRSKSPIERMRAYYQWVREEAAGKENERDCVLCKLALEQSKMSAPMRAAIRCSLDQLRAVTAQVIREAQQEGEIDASLNPEQLADFLTVSFEGAMIRVQVNGDIRPIDTFLHMVFEVLLK